LLAVWVWKTLAVDIPIWIENPRFCVTDGGLISREFKLSKTKHTTFHKVLIVEGTDFRSPDAVEILDSGG